MSSNEEKQNLLINTETQAHVPRGWLKNGNPPFDLRNAPRCLAKTRAGGSCQMPRMKNGRCRLHGGKSTGPKTPAGLEKSKRARWIDGRYSSECRTWRKNLHQFKKLSHQYLHVVLENLSAIKTLKGVEHDR